MTVDLRTTVYYCVLLVSIVWHDKRPRARILSMRDKDWRGAALCSGLPTKEAKQLFWLGRGKTANAAREFCNICPVRKECLNFALLYGEEGVWGGTTDEERKPMAKMLRPILMAAAIEAGTLESRDPRDFVPPVVHYPAALAQEPEPTVEQLMALSQELTNALLEF